MNLANDPWRRLPLSVTLPLLVYTSLRDLRDVFMNKGKDDWYVKHVRDEIRPYCFSLARLNKGEGRTPFTDIIVHYIPKFLTT